MSDERDLLMEALPPDLSRPEELPLMFHLMHGAPTGETNISVGNSRGYRTRLFMGCLPPKPVSRCFPA